MPADPEGAIQAVCNAVDKGRISSDRIQASYERIRWAKQGIGSPHPGSDDSTTHAWENISPPPVQLDQLALPDIRKTAIAILQDSMVCHIPTPLSPVKSGQNIILIDNSLDCDFLSRTAPVITAPNAHGYTHLTLLDQHSKSSNLPTLKAPQEGTLQNPKSKIQNGNVLLQLFVRGNPFRGSAGMSDRATSLLDDLLKQNCLNGLVIYGSPYLWETIKPTLPLNVPHVFTYGQMPMAQALVMRSLFGVEG